MKINRIYLFTALSTIALIVVLVIQVGWILETARVKEELFNEKANMVLSRTVEDLYKDEETCQQLGECIGTNEIQKIDELLQKNMRFYHFYLPYSFSLFQPDNSESATDDNVYAKRLDQIANENGLELVLTIPGKSEFIKAEMGSIFITSIALIILVLVLTWRTILSLYRQQQLAIQTKDFLNNMTHELKTPLTNIGLAGKMISKENIINDPEKINHYATILLSENEKLKQQVEQVLTLSSLESGELPLEKSRIDLHELLNEVCHTMSVQIENKLGSIKLHLLAQKKLLDGDKSHLTNAVRNLIDNAIKYSSHQPKIAIQTRTIDQQIELTISDNGCGIEKKHLDKIFENYFRVPTGDLHSVKGFGMGLCYTKTVIEKHGGSIEVSSIKGKGTVFTIKLPHGN